MFYGVTDDLIVLIGPGMEPYWKQLETQPV